MSNKLSENALLNLDILWMAKIGRRVQEELDL